MEKPKKPVCWRGDSVLRERLHGSEIRLLSTHSLSYTCRIVACVAGGIRERASRAAILPRGPSPRGNHQSSHAVATRVHGFAAKTKALAREIPPATQASRIVIVQDCCS